MNFVTLCKAHTNRLNAFVCLIYNNENIHRLTEMNPVCLLLWHRRIINIRALRYYSQHNKCKIEENLNLYLICKRSALLYLQLKKCAKIFFV